MKTWFMAMVCSISMFSFAVGAESKSPFAFADYLFERGDYYRAITEYERFVFQSPDDPVAPEARLMIARCYHRGRKLDIALSLLKDLKEDYSGKPIGRDIGLLLADVYYEQRSFLRAEMELDALEKDWPLEVPGVDEVRLRRALCQVRFGNAAWTREILSAVGTNSPVRPRADELLQSLPRAQLSPDKSPALAAGLSALLPGAGQWYVGRRGDAAVSLLVNGALVGAAVAAFRNDEPVAGAFIAVFESGWYFGNVYNAASSAHKLNARRRDAFFDDLHLRLGVFRSMDEKGSGVPGAGVGARF